MAANGSGQQKGKNERHAKDIEKQWLCFFCPSRLVYVQLFGNTICLVVLTGFNRCVFHNTPYDPMVILTIQCFFMFFLHLHPLVQDGLGCTTNPKQFWPAFWDGKMMDNGEIAVFVWKGTHFFTARGLRCFLPAMHAPCHAQWLAPTSPREKGEAWLAWESSPGRRGKRWRDLEKSLDDSGQRWKHAETSGFWAWFFGW